MKASCRVILEALNERGAYLCKLWEKPVLTEVDVKQRLAFTRRYKAKTAQWWNQHVHVFLDGKFFKTYLNAAARAQAAQHHAFGAFRAPRQGLSGGNVKAKKGPLCNAGSKNCVVMGAVGNGQVLLWHAVRSGRWSGQAAADMYKVLGSLRWSVCGPVSGRTWFWRTEIPPCSSPRARPPTPHAASTS